MKNSTAAVCALGSVLSVLLCLFPAHASDAVETVVEEIVRAEYRFSPVAEGAWSAPNRRHGLRARVAARGLELTPRTRETWRLVLSLSSLGRGTRRVAVDPVLPVQDAARVVLLRNGLQEWYANDERGLEQGFLLETRPEAAHPDGPLILRIAMGGDLAAFLGEDARDILFRDPAGRAVLRYGSLSVRDAAGREVDARLDLEGRSLLLRIEDENAVYPLSIDPLLTSPSWTTESNQVGARLGASVGTAGDVNGDGYSDVLLGAPLYDDGQADEGRAYLFLGSPSGLAAVPSWTLDSNQAGAQLGASVATAGDVNGDGFGDVLVGAPRYDDGQTDEGRVSLFLGSSSGLSGAPVWTVDGNQIGAQLGTSVAGAGDVDGDGLDDVLLGAPFFDNGQTDEGRALLFAGSPSGLATVPSWTAESNQAGAQLGASVAGAGDVDGNGFADVLVGAFAYDNGQTDEGRAYAFLGAASGLAATAAWTVESNQAGAEFGRSVAPAGDVNGDGYSDAIVGSHLYDAGENNEGRAFLYLGSGSGLSTLAAWTAESNQASSDFGFSVATAGDVNGDGYADVIVGAPLFKNGQRDEGVAFVYMGSSTGLGTTAAWMGEDDQMTSSFGFAAAAAGDVDGDGFGDVLVGSNLYDGGQNDEGRAYVFLGSAAGPAAAPGWTTESNQGGALLGLSVSTAGDVNGDGYSDVLVTAPQYDGGQPNEGKAFLFLGSPSGPAANPVWTAEGDQADCQFGYSASSAGDTNGDGYSDVVVGAYLYDNGQVNEGRAFVFLGSSSGPAAAPAWTAEGDQAGAQFGSSVACAGDVDGDGYADVIVGAYAYDHGQADEGRAFVFLGSPGGPAATPAWTAESDQAGAAFGAPVAGAGDVNGDGYSDVVIGAWLYGVFGRAYAFLGSPWGLSTAPAWVGEGDQSDELFGFPVASAGDVNGDGFSDVLVGATAYDVPQGVDEGRALLYLGSASGLSSLPAWSAAGDQEGAAFGYVRARAGDVNGDGYGDVVIGAPYYDSGQVNEGRAYLYLGSGSGLADQPAWFAESDQTGALLGYASGTAGDVNGDGFGDLVVGAYQWDNGAANAGKSYLFYGNGGAGVARAPLQARTDGTAPVDLLGKSDSESSIRLRALGRTAAGRGRLRLECEVKPLGASFDGSAIQRSDVQQTGQPDGSGSSTSFDLLVGALASGTPERWRLRTSGSSPFFPHSPWLTLAHNGRSETDFRTVGCHDLDQDGYGFPGLAACPAGTGTDCNDADPSIHPDVAELCDAIDNDCNGTVDGFATACGIGACAAQGTCIGGLDSCTPGAQQPEVCDGVDNDCDGITDNVPAPGGALVLSVTRESVSWTADARSTGYDVVRGNLTLLRSSGGDFTLTTDACLANDWTGTVLDDAAAPASGEGYWLLVRGVACCSGAQGTFDSGAASQVGSRDAEVGASPNACP